jgi:hypothetical protein
MDFVGSTSTWRFARVGDLHRLPAFYPQFTGGRCALLYVCFACHVQSPSGMRIFGPRCGQAHSQRLKLLISLRTLATPHRQVKDPSNRQGEDQELEAARTAIWTETEDSFDEIHD